MAATTEVTQENFQAVVAESEECWLLEFYSTMCGSCAEFEPTWHALEASDIGKSFKTARVNIDNNAGMQLATALGVLQTGIPSVRVYTNEFNFDADAPILTGDEALLDLSVLTSRLQKVADDLERNDEGICIKRFPFATMEDDLDVAE
uniref:Thioredoxin domain-containing protein n=1 Tax=Lotharella oceanica TaxID=641309 RepID=A0A7S2TVT9_9EUKA